MTADISVTAERNGQGMNCDARSATREEKPLPGEGVRMAATAVRLRPVPPALWDPVSPRGRLGVFQGASGPSTLRAASGQPLIKSITWTLNGTLNQHSHSHGGTWKWAKEKSHPRPETQDQQPSRSREHSPQGPRGEQGSEPHSFREAAWVRASSNSSHRAGNGARYRVNVNTPDPAILSS